MKILCFTLKEQIIGRLIKNKQIQLVFSIHYSGIVKKKLVEPKYFANTPIEQEFLIQQIRKLYLQYDQEEYDEKSNQKLGLFDTLNQRYKDLKSDEEWKIKQGLVLPKFRFHQIALQIQLIHFVKNLQSNCGFQKKDQRIRNLFKDQNLISVQMKILQKNWQTQLYRILGEMQKRLNRIDELQEQISHEPNLNKRDLQLKEMEETTLQLDEYIQNISEMGQQLKLINHFRKSLIRVEGKINQMKEQLNSINNDIKFLRGKSVEQLLEIRKWKVLKESAYNNIQSIYVQLNTQEKGKNDLSNSMNLEQFDAKI